MDTVLLHSDCGGAKHETIRVTGGSGAPEPTFTFSASPALDQHPLRRVDRGFHHFVYLL